MPLESSALETDEVSLYFAAWSHSFKCALGFNGFRYPAGTGVM